MSIVLAMSPSSLRYNVESAARLAGDSSTTILWPEDENQGFFVLGKTEQPKVEDVDLETYNP